MTQTSATQTSIKNPQMFPKLRENIWHINPHSATALLITSQESFEVPTEAALKFLKMRSYCTGHHSVEDIANKSGLSVEEVTSILQSLENIDLLCSSSNSNEKFALEDVRNALMRVCDIWSDELRHTYIGNEFALGKLPKTALIGWLLEMYHYIKDFPYAIEHGANHAKGKLKDVLVKYANEEKGHEEFVVQTLMNLGMSRQEIQTSVPLLSTRMIGFLMRELFELEPGSPLIVAAVIEAQEFDQEQIQLFKEKLDEYYGVGAQTFDPYFEHQKIDVGLGHAQLLASNLDLIEIDALPQLNQLVNKIHDLKHAFDLQGLEIKEYFTTLNGKYVPRQPIDFTSI